MAAGRLATALTSAAEAPAAASFAGGYAAELGVSGDNWHTVGLQPFGLQEATMRKTLIAIAGVVAFLSGTHGTSAFTTQPANPTTMSNRLADPDDLADRMSNGQSAGTIFGQRGRPTLEFSAPPSAGSMSSPFVTSPSTVFVPSERR
jgi:hypothetical protein